MTPVMTTLVEAVQTYAGVEEGDAAATVAAIRADLEAIYQLSEQSTVSSEQLPMSSEQLPVTSDQSLVSSLSVSQSLTPDAWGTLLGWAFVRHLGEAVGVEAGPAHSRRPG